MILVRQSVEVLDYNKGLETTIERAGRTCWKSEGKIEKGSCDKFIRMIKNKKHFAMLEFCWVAVKIITNRTVSHQLVRHRHFSFAQESQHYIRYNGDMTFVVPEWLPFPDDLINVVIDEQIYSEKIYGILQHKQQMFVDQMFYAENSYRDWLQTNAKAQEARCCLPNNTKTEICMAGNGRSWCEFFNKRLGDENTKDIQMLSLAILDKLMLLCPTVFLEVTNDAK